jgi:hypothetical protein
MEGSDRESDEQLIEELVRRIGRWKLVLPARILLEITKPFGFIAGQGLLLCQPLLGYFVEEPWIAGYADLLGNRGSLARLANRLEETQYCAANGDEGRG